MAAVRRNGSGAGEKKQGDAYRAKQREYVKAVRERKALVNGGQGESI